MVKKILEKALVRIVQIGFTRMVEISDLHANGEGNSGQNCLDWVHIRCNVAINRRRNTVERHLEGTTFIVYHIRVMVIVMPHQLLKNIQSIGVWIQIPMSIRREEKLEKWIVKIRKFFHLLLLLHAYYLKETSVSYK